MTETVEDVTTALIEAAPIADIAPVDIAPMDTVVEAPVPVESVIAEEGKAAESTTVLGEALKAESKPETEVKEESKETEGSQSDEPAPLPTYDAFTAPEGFPLEGGRVSDIVKVLGEFENSSKDHAEVQKLGQALIDRHVAAVQNIQELIKQNFEKTKTDWKNAFVSDPEIGGNRKDTTVSSALEFIRTHGGTPEQQAEIHELLDNTGTGNHKAMIRLLANANRNLAEGKPLPANKPMPEAKNKYEKFYGKT